MWEINMIKWWNAQGNKLFQISQKWFQGTVIYISNLRKWLQHFFSDVTKNSGYSSENNIIVERKTLASLFVLKITNYFINDKTHWKLIPWNHFELFARCEIRVKVHKENNNIFCWSFAESCYNYYIFLNNCRRKIILIIMNDTDIFFEYF